MIWFLYGHLTSYGLALHVVLKCHCTLMNSCLITQACVYFQILHLLHGSPCPSLYQWGSMSTTVAWWQVLKAGGMGLPPSSLFFVTVLLSILGPRVSIWISATTCQFLQKRSARIVIMTIQNLSINSNNKHLKNVDSSTLRI